MSLEFETSKFTADAIIASAQHGRISCERTRIQ